MVQDETDLLGNIRYLDVEDLVDFNKALIHLTTPDEQSGVFNAGLLESAQQRPSQFRYYAQTNDLLLLGAVLFTALIQNHPFHNGNKRTAFTACRVFLLLNGAHLDPPLEEVLEVCRAVALRELDDDQVASWISKYTRPIDCEEYLEGTGDALSALSELDSDSH